MAVERESMEFDVVIVGAGPSGLSASIKLMQLSEQQGLDLNICVLEKSSDIGSHIISGAVVETHALDELLPDWEASDAFIRAPVTRDQMSFLINQTASIGIPSFLIPILEAISPAPTAAVIDLLQNRPESNLPLESVLNSFTIMNDSAIFFRASRPRILTARSIDSTLLGRP